MNRTQRYKIAYAVAMVCAIAFAIYVLVSFRDRVWVALVVALVFLIPGRFQGFFYRDFYRGRRLLDGKQSAEAIPHFETFLSSIYAAPWLRHLLWLQFSVYTPNVEAMTLNNIGAAQLNLGRLGEAEESLRRALAIDQLYAIPHYNLAVVHSLRGQQELAEQASAEAVRLGFVQSKMDTVLSHAQSLLAHVEGRGVSA